MANTDKIGKRYGHLTVIGVDYERDKKGYDTEYKTDKQGGFEDELPICEQR